MVRWVEDSKDRVWCRRRCTCDVYRLGGRVGDVTENGQRSDKVWMFLVN